MRRFEPATLALILLCFLATGNMEWRDLDAFEGGAICAPLLWSGAWERVPWAVFLHGGWIHFAFNALALYVVGRVIVVGLGRFAMIFFLLGAAGAGVAASLLVLPPVEWRVGISGGVAGLVGMILAVEWALARDMRGWFRSRNVRVILFLIALNAGLAVAIEIGWSGIHLDHAAHIAGLAWGLATGLCWYVRGRGARPVRGVAAGALLALVPLAYASAPVFSDDWDDPQLHAYGGTLALVSGHETRAERAYARAWERDPTMLEAAARLAGWRDDPAYLDRAAAPEGGAEARLLLETLLDLAARRLDTRPQGAEELYEKARLVGIAGAGPWEEFADRARHAGRDELALRAEREALRRQRRARATGASAGRAKAVLDAIRGLPDFHESDLAEARERARLVWEAAARLADGDLPPADRAAEQRQLTADLQRAVDEALAAGRAPPAAARVATALLLKRAWRRLAELAVVRVHAARYRVRAAHWAETEHAARVEAGEPDAEGLARLGDEIEGLYRAAYAEGRETRDPVAVARAGHWLRARGIEPPGAAGG